MLDLAWVHKWEPYSNEELRKLGRIDLITDNEESEEVGETVSQFQACVDEILLRPYKQTIYD